MKREIKFRYISKLNTNPEMLFIDFYTLEQIEQIAGDFRPNCTIIAKDRYIGINDKNKAEIYENDIWHMPSRTETVSCWLPWS
jgi:hypothetical protein